MLRNGDKVLCINDTVDRDKAHEIFNDFQRWVEKGKVYYIREILYNKGIVTGVLLKDLYNIPVYLKLIGKKQEPAFGTFRFEKLKKSYSDFHEDEKIFGDCPDDVMEKVEKLLIEN